LRHPGPVTTEIVHRILHTLTAAAHRLFPVAVALVAALVAYSVIGAAIRARWARRGRWVEIAPPAEPDAAGGLALWRMLAPLLAARRTLVGRRPPVAFECHADVSGLRVGLWVSPTMSATGVAQAVEVAWRGARATVTDLPRLPAAGTAGGRAHLARRKWFPLASGDHTAADPIGGLLSTLVGFTAGESAVVQILARPAAGRRVAKARRAARAIRRGQASTTLGRAVDLVQGRTSGGRSPASGDPLALADVREVTAKVAAAPHFVVAVRYAVTGGSGHDATRRRRAHLRQITAALGLYAGPNHLVGRRLPRAATVLGRRRLRRGFLASAPELAALAHLPTQPASYGLPTAAARRVAPPPGVAHA